MSKLMKLNLQFFGENPEEDPTNSEQGTGTEPTEPPADPTPEGNPEGAGTEEKTFTQAELDRIIKERLQREEKKREAALEKERLDAEQQRQKEQGEYKELADSLQEKLDKLEAEKLEASKTTALVKAGYDEEQVEKLLKFIEGETDEEIAASLDELKTLVPVGKTYADPSSGNSKKSKPPKEDPEKIGKSAYQRLKEKGKIRRGK